MIARNKKQPEYNDYVSYYELVSMLNACSSIIRLSWNYRIYSTNVHLVLEIALKKPAIHYEVSVSTTQHRVGSLLHKLSYKDVAIRELTHRLSENGTISLLQKFPYDDLRFHSKVDGEPMKPEELLDITKTVLRRLEYIESVRRNKNMT